MEKRSGGSTRSSPRRSFGHNPQRIEPIQDTPQGFQLVWECPVEMVKVAMSTSLLRQLVAAGLG